MNRTVEAWDAETEACNIGGGLWKVSVFAEGAPGYRLAAESFSGDRETALVRGLLIAAAPDLLAALEGLMWRFDGAEPDLCNDPDVLLARAAITKAKGEG
jgi:hypothetical protein